MPLPGQQAGDPGGQASPCSRQMFERQRPLRHSRPLQQSAFAVLRKLSPSQQRPCCRPGRRSSRCCHCTFHPWDGSKSAHQNLLCRGRESLRPSGSTDSRSRSPRAGGGSPGRSCRCRGPRSSRSHLRSIGPRGRNICRLRTWGLERLECSSQPHPGRRHPCGCSTCHCRSQPGHSTHSRWRMFHVSGGNSVGTWGAPVTCS